MLREKEDKKLNKKGLSTIVTTLIIILLSLAAIGIVWAVVNGLLKSNTQGISVSAKCLNIDVEAASANCSAGTTNYMCTVQLTRAGTGNDEIAGVKLVFMNDTSGISSPSTISVDGNIEALIPETVTEDSGIPITSDGINKVEVTPFFKDASGNEQLCSQTTSLSF